MSIDATAKSYLDAIAERVNRRPPPGAFTKYDLMASAGIERERARNMLEAEVRAGRLVSEKFYRPDGKHVRYYWPK